MDQAQKQIEEFERQYQADEVVPGSMLERLLFWYWWLKSSACKIRDVHAEEIGLEPNRTQRIVIARMMQQASEGRPIRIIILKARKTGVSTLIQSLFVFLCSTYTRQVASMIAHLADSTEEIFRIGSLMAKNWVWGKSANYRHRIDWGDSRYGCHTAGAAGVGASGTPNLLHLSEVALWRVYKVETEYTATNAVPKGVPTTCIVYESTARGRDLFWERFDVARKSQNNYAAVFIPWYFDERNISVTPASEPYEPEEDVLIRQAAFEGIELTAYAVQFRREGIAEMGESTFKQEFPSTAEEAVAGTRGYVLPGLRECIVDKIPFEYNSLAHYTERVGGWDHGYNDPTAMVSAVFKDQVLWILDVYRESEQLAERHAQAVLPYHRYYCDPAALQARKELGAATKRLGVNAQFLPAPRKQENKATTIVKTEWEEVLRYIQSGRLKVHRDCADQLCLEADNFFWNEKTGEPDQKRGGAWGHFDTLDALRYLVMGVSRGTARVPRLTGGGASRREMLRA